MNALVDSRTWAFTALFQLASYLGEIEGYVLVVTFVYVAIDKRLAIRLAVLVLLTMTVNHVLKIIVQNPRPFVAEGTYLQKWAVSPENARELATEYSTPSGHAMAGAAFYLYLALVSRRRLVAALAIAAVALTGLSRPYLGVHYAEDIIIGWIVGGVIATAAFFVARPVEDLWARIPYAGRIAAMVAVSIALWAWTVALNGGQFDGQPRAFLAYVGLLTGIVAAAPLERRFVNFYPQSDGMGAKLIHYAVTVATTLIVLRTLREAFALLAQDVSLLGSALHYVRYAIAGGAAIFLGPLLFARLRSDRSAGGGKRSIG